MEQKTSIKYIWKHNVAHHYVNQTDEITANNHILQIVDLMQCDNILDLDSNPQLIDILRQKLSEYIQPSGKNKGKNYSFRTIKEYLRLLRRVIKTYDENHKLKHLDLLLKKTSSDKYRSDKNLTKKERLPLNTNDYKRLFMFLAEIKKHRYAQINFMLKMNPQHKKELLRIKNNPEVYYYSILIALFTGSRANAVNTLRHQDIDLENKIFRFNKNNILDEREELKKLKTDESNRSVPIANILFENLGLKQYLKIHEKIHGSESFIFEEAIKNSTSYNPSIINIGVNILFQCLDIKPERDSNYMKDYHSLKKSFYSANCKSGIPLEMLEAIAGNKPSDTSIAAKYYTQISMETASESMFEAINKITYPHIEILIGKKQIIKKQTNNNELIKNYITEILGEPVKKVIIIT